MGYWKGSGMAIALDMAAALLANGRSGDQINADELGSCGGCCQIFLAFDPYLFGSKEEAEEMLNRRIAARTDLVAEIVCGLPIFWKGEDVYAGVLRSAGRGQG